MGQVLDFCLIYCNCVDYITYIMFIYFLDFFGKHLHIYTTSVNTFSIFDHDLFIVTSVVTISVYK